MAIGSGDGEVRASVGKKNSLFIGKIAPEHALLTTASVGIHVTEHEEAPRPAIALWWAPERRDFLLALARIGRCRCSAGPPVLALSPIGDPG